MRNIHYSDICNPDTVCGLFHCVAVRDCSSVPGYYWKKNGAVVVGFFTSFSGRIIPDVVEKCIDNFANTASFNVTGHPALSLKAGYSDGLPVGAMIVGRHFDDVTVLKVARAFEQVRAT